MGALSISAQTGIGLGPRHTGGGTPTPTPSPVFSVQPSITGTPQVGVSFVGTPGTASNTTGHTYRWLLATTSGGTYAAISGATSASYTPVSGDETKYLKFEDTATGPGGSTVATTTFAGPVAAVGITAPVITQTSTAGANPFLWTTTENATFFAGFYWNVVTATGASTGAASTNLLAGTTNADIIQQIETGDLAGTAPITFTGLTTTSLDGAFAIRERVGSEDGLGGYNWGAWSNVLTDTLATPSTPAAWVATNGVGKSQYVTVTGSNLIVTGQSGFAGAPISVRADQLRTGKRQFQTTLGTAPYGIWIGVDDGTTNFNSGFVRPGKDNSAGISLTADSFGWVIWVGGVSVQSGGSGSSVILASDILTCTFDTVGGTVSFYLTRSGTTTQFGTAQAVSLSLWYANAGFENGTSQTALFASGQARTLDSGYSYYG
jgi:hypothetical protein